MHWRNSLLAAVLLLVSGAISAAAPPNVILVLLDDAGYGDFSCHGNPVLKTPHIDKLYAQSVRLTDFHVAPMCTPTRGQILSGVDALRNGAMNVASGRVFLRRELPTMANLFADTGYRTGLFGKWHVGDSYPYRPQDRGFQQAMWHPASHIPSASEYWRNTYTDTWFRHEDGQIRQSKGYCTDVLFDEAMHWIDQSRSANKPFFCYLPLNSPHCPLLVPEKYSQPYADQPPAIAFFLGMMANIDENMGRLTAMLDQMGLADNTILIFMTDNGATFGAPVFNAGMRAKKMELYDGGHRVPCFIRWPDGKLGKQPRDIGELTEAQDLLPTLVDLCGLKAPDKAHFDGVDLARLLRGKEDRFLAKTLADRMLVVQYSRVHSSLPVKGDAAVLWGKWRLVAEKELFDIAADPGQAHDVAAEHPDIVKQMRAHYDKWWSEIEPTVNQLGAITIGSDAENPLMLSPVDWADSFLDQSVQIRNGVNVVGAWNVEVERAGEYEISLRRWPQESHLAIDAPDPTPLRLEEISPIKGPSEETVVGKALPIAKARLRIQGQDRSISVAQADQAAVFNLSLKPGRTQLETWFYDAKGAELCSAYYVYVRRE
jgi:arylsulfatase A-like enzyme